MLSTLTLLQRWRTLPKRSTNASAPSRLERRPKMWSTVNDLIGGKARNERDDRRQKLLDWQREREDVDRAEGEQRFRDQVKRARQRGTFTTDVSVGRRVLDHVLT